MLHRDRDTQTIRKGVAAIDWENEADRHAREKEESSRMTDSTVATPAMSLAEYHNDEVELPENESMHEDESTAENEQKDNDISNIKSSPQLDDNIEVDDVAVASEGEVTIGTPANTEQNVTTARDLPVEVTALTDSIESLPNLIVAPVLSKTSNKPKVQNVGSCLVSPVFALMK